MKEDVSIESSGDEAMYDHRPTEQGETMNAASARKFRENHAQSNGDAECFEITWRNGAYYVSLLGATRKVPAMSQTSPETEMADKLERRANYHTKFCKSGLSYFSDMDSQLLHEAATVLRGLAQTPADAAALTERLIEAAVDYEKAEGIYSAGARRELSESRAAVEAAILGHAQTPAEAQALRVVRQMVEAYDSGNLQMSSPEIGEPENDIPYHPWHEQLLHYARLALSDTSTDREGETDHIDWDILAEERLGQRPRSEHGSHSDTSTLCSDCPPADRDPDSPVGWGGHLPGKIEP